MVMYKIAYFRSSDSTPVAIPLFSGSDQYFEKVASPRLVPEVARYIDTLRPAPDSQYILVNAMGASEYYGNNINGDIFYEEALIHAPDHWSGNPVMDKVLSKKWPYGMPTFYNAFAYTHHRNKDPLKSVGDVELVAWNPRMKRVELVIRLDKSRSDKFGGTGAWDKLKAGEFMDVSMGCKVPFDLCDYCTDSPLYEKALATFNPKVHAHPGRAVLEFHKRLKAQNGIGIRGLAVTRNDYCDHAKHSMNRIMPNGIKIGVINTHPSFFDISFVFIGADKTAKSMLKIASDEKVAKTAKAKVALLKGAVDKKSEIIKDVTPQFMAGHSVPVMTQHEPVISRMIIKVMASKPIEDVIDTTASHGVILRPCEFQKILMSKLGLEDEAEELDRSGILFPEVDESENMPLGRGRISDLLSSLLAPLLRDRSILGPHVEKRVVIAHMSPDYIPKSNPSYHSELLNKIGAAYKGYRKSLEEGLPEYLTNNSKTASVMQLTPLSYAYLEKAYWDEVSKNGTGFGQRGGG